MAVSGTRSFIRTRESLIASAYRKIHAIGPNESPSPGQTTAAQEALNQMVLSWQNDGIFLWTQNEEYAKLTADTNYVTLDADTLEVRDVRFYSNETETIMSPLTREEYKGISNKADGGDPTSYWVDFALAAPVMYLYPRPENTTGLVTGTDTNEYHCTNDHTSATATNKPITGSDYDDYWTSTTLFGTGVGTWANATAYYSDHIRFVKIIRLQDFAAAANNPDFPVRYYQSLVYGLAVELAHEYGIMDAEYDKLVAKFTYEYARARGADHEMMGVSFGPRF